MNRILFLFSFIFIFFHSAFSQEIEFTNISPDDGLSLNAVTSVLQDSRGFMWFGTYNGLNRFDGYNFKIYLPEPSNSNSISNHSIHTLLEDSQGIIWIGTSEGLNAYDWRTEKFTKFFHDSTNPASLCNNYVSSIYEDNSGILWIGTLKGLSKYDRKKNSFSNVEKLNNVFSQYEANAILSILQDHSGSLWIGLWNGLFKASGKDVSKVILPGADKFAAPYNDVTEIFEDHQNNIWIGTKGKGLYRYDTKSESFSFYRHQPGNPHSISGNIINAIYQDSRNNLWIGSNEGLNKFDYSSNNFTAFRNDPNESQSIYSNEIFSLIEDKTGIIWIGTSSGVSRFYEPQNNFKLYSVSGYPLNFKNPDYVNILYQGSGNSIWIGTRKELKKINSVSGEQLGVISDINLELNNNPVWSLLEDKTGDLWIGTESNGLYKFKNGSGKPEIFRSKNNDNRSLSNDGVISLLEDNQGMIWAGTWWGLNRYDKKAGKFKRYISDFGNTLIQTLHQDSYGNIWVGTDGAGYYKYNKKADKFESFTGPKGNNLGLDKARAISIMNTNDGLLWMGTFDGLICYDDHNQKIEMFTKDDGLISSIVNTIREDNNGNLWLGSDKGITRFDRKTRKFTGFSKRDGLKDIDFTSGVAAKTQQGVMLLGGKLGITLFSPDRIKNRFSKTNVVLTDFKINNRSVDISESSVLNQSIACTKYLQKPYDNDVITIEFALLDYYNSQKNNYFFKLNGFDSKWNDVGRRNSATYTNLSPGEYTFMVKASGDNGIVSEITALKIIIVPAYYQTVWFKILLSLALVVLTAIIINARTKSIRKRNSLLEQRIADRTKVLDKTIANLSNEIIEHRKAEEKVQASLEEKEILLKEIHHRVKNNLQVISSLLYLQSIKAKDEDTLHLFEDSQNRIKSMALIHEKLYQSKDFAQVNFSEYVRSLLDYLNRTFKKSGLFIKTRVDINNINLSLDTAISCGLIVNELFTNAYKYAFPSSWVKEQPEGIEFLIEISITAINEKQFILCVRDNGAGISKDIDVNNASSLGLKLVQSMVRQLDGTIEIINNRGAQFKITFVDIGSKYE